VPNLVEIFGTLAFGRKALQGKELSRAGERARVPQLSVPGGAIFALHAGRQIALRGHTDFPRTVHPFEPKTSLSEAGPISHVTTVADHENFFRERLFLTGGVSGRGAGVA
jgi:hypothetical protein